MNVKELALGLILGTTGVVLIMPLLSDHWENGRYSFTPITGSTEVLIGDSRTGKSWRCDVRFFYEDSKASGFLGVEMPKNYNGCYEIVNPITPNQSK